MMRDRRGHLDDDDLVQAYLDDSVGADPDAGAAWRLHLRICPECVARYRALAGGLHAAAQDAAEEADAVFTPDRLARQREAILRRLEQAERAARVIPFPTAAPRSMPAAHGVTRRWIAAAAAAGLLIGLVAGRAIDGTGGASRLLSRFGVSAPATTARVPATPVLTSGAAADLPAEENFLIELDAALESSRVTELVAIDELTPRIVEAGTLSDLGGIGEVPLDFPAGPAR